MNCISFMRLNKFGQGGEERDKNKNAVHVVPKLLNVRIAVNQQH